MDRADVGKVMRPETPTWIKDPDDPMVAPVKRALFRGWEGNWMGYKLAHDVKLAGSTAGKVGFLMYPQAETDGVAYDLLDPDSFSASPAPGWSTWPRSSLMSLGSLNAARQRCRPV
jgi:hypothetical protein